MEPRESAILKLNIRHQLGSREFNYPHGQDKNTLFLNKILNNIVLNDEEFHQKSGYKFEFKCEIVKQKYNLNVITPRPFSNYEILFEVVYQIVEECLKWLDLSEIDNFEIKVSDGGELSKCTYYDLASWALDRRDSAIISYPLYSKEKMDKIRQYRTQIFEQERFEYNRQMVERHMSPEYRFELTQIQSKKEKPNKLKKLINKFKNYANINI